MKKKNFYFTLPYHTETPAAAAEQTDVLPTKKLLSYQKIKCIAEHPFCLKFQVPAYCGD